MVATSTEGNERQKRKNTIEIDVNNLYLQLNILNLSEDRRKAATNEIMK